MAAVGHGSSGQQPDANVHLLDAARAKAFLQKLQNRSFIAVIVEPGAGKDMLDHPCDLAVVYSKGMSPEDVRLWLSEALLEVDPNAFDE